MLEQTGIAVGQAQVLDKLEVERERGITVKAQTALMNYQHQGQDYLLNLIDTPGHVDFSYEVSRSLRACDGAVLLVDAISGIQAQTISNFYQALDAGLAIIPAINKVDSPSANVESAVSEINDQFDLQDIHMISAKTGLGVSDIFPAIIDKIPPPKGDINARPKAFLFDSYYTHHKGVVCIVKMIDGSLRKGSKIKSMANNKHYEVQELGVMRLDLEPTEELVAGQVGYVTLAMKNTSEGLIGDTFCLSQDETTVALKGFKFPKSMVYAGVYPEDPAEYGILQKAIEKYTLQDRSLSIERDVSLALGNGFRCGFLGLLHLDIFKQRLEAEYQVAVMTTNPNVNYLLKLKGGKQMHIINVNDMPERFKIVAICEPFVEVSIMVPKSSYSAINNYCMDLRGEQSGYESIGDDRCLLKFQMPLSEIITDFFDNLKSMTQGLATLDYEHIGYYSGDLGRFDIFVAGEKIDSLSSIVHNGKAYNRGRSMCRKLRELLPKQLFEVAIQAAFNGRIIARETIKAFRKDVTAKCYGGDESRKRKLREKQKEGKKRMRSMGRVNVDAKTYGKILRS